MLKLHELDRSPFSWKVRIVLAEKNIPHESVPAADRQTDEAYARLNPFKLAPMIELGDGRAIHESTVIGEYLEEVHPQPAMLPKDPYERARLRMVEDTTDQYFYPSMKAFVLAQYAWEPPYLIRKAAADVDAKGRDEARAKIEKHLDYLESQLGTRRWFGGDMVSLADAGIIPALCGGMRLHGFLPGDRWPNLSSYVTRAMELPSVVKSQPKVPLTIKD